MRSTFVLIAVLMIASAAQGNTDCTLSRSVLDPYVHASASPAQWRAAREAVDRLYMCPSGPVDRASRQVFFELVGLVFQRPLAKSADRAGSEAAYESAMTFQYELLQDMDRFVTEGDAEFKNVILRTANGLAISKLGRAAQYDVLRIARTADRAEVGIHHSPFIAGLEALGHWIDPSETRFTAQEKREMTDILIQVAEIPRPDYRAANAAVDALAHSDQADAEHALRKLSVRERTAGLPDLADRAAQAAAGVHRRIDQAARY